MINLLLGDQSIGVAADDQLTHLHKYCILATCHLSENSIVHDLS
jgi:hypothetical protein